MASRENTDSCAAVHARRGFSLVELVIVVVIVGIVSSIAVPRFSAMSARSKTAALKQDVTVLETAIENYRAEHSGRDITIDSDGTPDPSPKAIQMRLTGLTDDTGSWSGAGIFGPYLVELPKNPFNSLSTIRPDGAPAGANTAGWRYDSVRQRVQPDHAGVATEYLEELEKVESENAIANEVAP